MKARKQKKNFALIFGIVAVLLLYLIIPIYLNIKATAIIEQEGCLSAGSMAAPSPQLSIAINFLDYAALFPGFSSSAEQKKAHLIIRCTKKYQENCKAAAKKSQNDLKKQCANWQEFIKHAKIEKYKKCD